MHLSPLEVALDAILKPLLFAARDEFSQLGRVLGLEDSVAGACRRALDIRAHSYKSVHSILKNRLDEKPLPPPEEPTRKPIVHGNIRGATYYHAEHRAGEKLRGASTDEEATSEHGTEHTTPEPTYH